MKMTKRFILPAMFLLASTGFVRAQGLFFTVTPGYHFPAGKGSGLIGGNFSSSSGTTTNEELLYSFGKGLNVGASVGTMFNENMGLDLGFTYLLGGKYETEDKITTMAGTSTTKWTTYGRMFRISPSLIMQTGEDMKLYMRFGAVIGFGRLIQEMDDNDAGDKTFMKQEFSGGLSTGIIAGLGFSASLSESMSFFAELQSITQSFAPKKGEVTEATFNGQDQLGSMTTNEKEIEFVDKYTQSGPPNANEPDKQVRQTFPFSSFGLQVGIRLNLGQ